MDRRFLYEANGSLANFRTKERTVLMSKMGYILSELFMLLLVIAMAKWILLFRRGLSARPLITDNDRRLLKEPIRVTGNAPVRYLRYALAFTLVVIFGALELAVVSQFGATILTGTLLLTSAAVVRWTLVRS
jgi:hypothetical protein